MAVQTKVSNDSFVYGEDPPRVALMQVLNAQIATWVSEGKTDGVRTYEDKNGDGYPDWVLRLWTDQTAAEAYVDYVNNLFGQYGWPPLNQIEYIPV